VIFLGAPQSTFSYLKSRICDWLIDCLLASRSYFSCFFKWNEGCELEGTILMYRMLEEEEELGTPLLPDSHFFLPVSYGLMKQICIQLTSATFSSFKSLTTVLNLASCKAKTMWTCDYRGIFKVKAITSSQWLIGLSWASLTKSVINALQCSCQSSVLTSAESRHES